MTRDEKDVLRGQLLLDHIRAEGLCDTDPPICSVKWEPSAAADIGKKMRELMQMWSGQLEKAKVESER